MKTRTWTPLLLAIAAALPAAAAEPRANQEIQAQQEQGAQAGQGGQPAPRREAEPSPRELRTPEERRAATRAVYNGAYQRNLFNEPAAAEREFAAAQERMEQLNPRDDGDTYQGAVLFQRGYLLKEAGDFDGALKRFEELVKRYPRNPYADDALYHSGYIYQYQKKDYARAAEAYTRVAEMYADRETAGKAMWENAQVAVMANDDANVNPRLTQAVVLNRNDRYSRGNTTVPNFYETQARQQQDFIDNNKAGLTSQRPVNQYLQAENFMRQGRLVEAEGNLQKIASQFPQAKLAAAAAFGLAECRRRAGKLDEAMKLYEDFLTRYPDSELVPKARFMLAELKRIAGLDAEAREHYARVKRQLQEMSRKVEYYGKGGSRIVEVELSADLERLKQVTEARLREVAAEQQKQIGK